MNTDKLLTHINLDELISNRFYSCLHDSDIQSIQDLYSLYYSYKKISNETFQLDWFLKYFKSTNKCTSQIDGSYCFVGLSGEKVILKRFLPYQTKYSSWNPNTLYVAKTKFLKYKYEITDTFNRK